MARGEAVNLLLAGSIPVAYPTSHRAPLCVGRRPVSKTSFASSSLDSGAKCWRDVVGNMRVFQTRFAGSSPAARTNVPVVQWIGREATNLEMRVRLLPGIPPRMLCNGST